MWRIRGGRRSLIRSVDGDLITQAQAVSNPLLDIQNTQSFDSQESNNIRSMFGTTAKCTHLTNNVVESFNAFIGDARAKPIIFCIDAIRLKIMPKINYRRMSAERWKGVLVPEAQKQLMELSKNKGMYDVHRSSNDRAEVDGPEGRWDVILSEKYCSCRRWQVTGMPCNYAAAVIAHMRNARWEDYVDECYSVARYKAA
ncbi:hypothetical protein QJS10_CPB13g00783 [Acorus calamus]|uniref:SWIM-type domain-containing protein n=1 Tax=Acorus calamus TaxID=4465 RepID=A0AAV9DGT5_ACOCL|nr:hypothetical protein QJS10_CPB13g00783 [Acorus calamus]